MEIEKLTFNSLEVNTYVVYDATKECVIIDPGCINSDEKNELKQFISDNGLKPKILLNTHCHFDHIFGNNFVCSEYGIEMWASEKELPNLGCYEGVAELFEYSDKQPVPSRFLENGQVVKFGNSELKVINTPGHSPGSVCFYSEAENFIIVGDTIFLGSIGRTDMFGGDYPEIKESIKMLLELPAETKAYCGHGPSTSIGKEKLYSPILARMFGSNR
jgi:glyoxylase-like metal-dependent hydrolase (beta-lactamase superfamily II)